MAGVERRHGDRLLRSPYVEAFSNHPSCCMLINDGGTLSQESASERTKVLGVADRAYTGMMSGMRH